MKTFFSFLVSLCLWSNLLYSQAVGIGTSNPNPSAMLDVNSTSSGLLIPRMTAVQRNAIKSPAAGLMVYENGTAAVWLYNGSDWVQMASGVGASSPWLTSGTGNYVYNSTDSIGIGTSLPLEKLNIHNGQLRINRSSLSLSNNILFNMPNASFAGEFEGLKFQVAGTDRSSIGFLNSPTFSPPVVGLRLSGNGISSNDLFINTSGDIGIGTNLPLKKLDVVGDIGASGSFRAEGTIFTGSSLSVADNIVAGGIGIILGEVTSNAGFIVNSEAGLITLRNSGDKGFIQTSGDNLRLGTFSSNTNGKVVIRTGGGDRMTVDGSGVAIGTTAAAAGYMLRLGGKMICEEVKVKLVSTWPDYVFESDYPLPDIKELANFIRQNKHLPNIPSAGEIAENGLDVGDMQKRMMEKIEELTLYIIDQQKQIDALKTLMSQKVEIK